jgi:hypothetical protein
MGEMRNVYKVLLRKYEGRRPHMRSWHKWKENIKMDLKEIWFEDVDGIQLAHESHQ